MLLELIFTVILQNITHARTDARTRSPLLGLLVGAKNQENETQFFLFCLYTELKLFHFFGFDV